MTWGIPSAAASFQPGSELTGSVGVRDSDGRATGGRGWPRPKSAHLMPPPSNPYTPLQKCEIK